LLPSTLDLFANRLKSLSGENVFVIDDNFNRDESDYYDDADDDNDLCLCLSLSFFDSLSLSLSLFDSLSLSVSLSRCLSVSLSLCLCLFPTANDNVGDENYEDCIDRVV